MVVPYSNKNLMSLPTIHIYWHKERERWQLIIPTDVVPQIETFDYHNNSDVPYGPSPPPNSSHYYRWGVVTPKK